MKNQKRWGVYIEFKANFTPVNFQLWIAFSYDAAFQFFADKRQTRRQKFFVKRLGTRHRWYEFDEKFSQSLQIEDDIDPDEYEREQMERFYGLEDAFHDCDYFYDHEYDETPEFQGYHWSWDGDFDFVDYDQPWNDVQLSGWRWVWNAQKQTFIKEYDIPF